MNEYETIIALLRAPQPSMESTIGTMQKVADSLEAIQSAAAVQHWKCSEWNGMRLIWLLEKNASCRAP